MDQDASPEIAVQSPDGQQPTAFEAVVEVWFQDLRRNLPSLSAEDHNRLFAAKEDLKHRLQA